MNAPYGLVPIGLFLILIYSISWFFSRLDILSKAAHRRIWNYALLAVFLATALLGLLLAVQVNARLEIPWTEKALKWHVNFGIAMSLVGFFHLFWHLSYYFGRRNARNRAVSVCGPSAEAASSPPPAGPAGGSIVLPFAIGFAGVLVQTLVIRDVLTLFEGNELTASLIIFLWLLLAGAGSLAGSAARLSGRRAGNPGTNAAGLVRILLLVPAALFPLMTCLRSFLFAPGVEAGPAAMGGFLAVILLPFCVLNGFSFTWTARALRTGGRPLRSVYGWESIGGAVGGAFAAAAVLAGLPSVTIVLLASAGLFFWIASKDRSGGPFRWAWPAVLAVLAVFVQAASVDRLLLKRIHPNETILKTASGSSGRLTVARMGDQVNVYENGVLSHASGNVFVNEELASFALIQPDRLESVLVIGGLLTGLSEELAKYRGVRADFVEPDPRLISLAGDMGLIADIAGIRIVRRTPAAWLAREGLRYDAVLVDLPGPRNLQLNRFYTAGFFKKIKNALASGGAAAAVLPGTANYVSEAAASTLAPVVAAARESFEYARIFPGENSVLVMSDRPLKTAILAELGRRGIANHYVNDGYFDEDLFVRRMEQVNLSVGPASPNSDLKPAAYLSQIRWWLGRFPRRGLVFGGLAVAALLLGGVLVGRPLLAGMFLVGAASSGWTVTLLLLVQVIAGALYQWTGLFLGTFMIGLAAGSLFHLGRRKGRGPAGAAISLPVFIAVAGIVGAFSPALALGGGPVLLKMALLLGADFLAAAAVGACFAGLSVRLESDNVRHDRLYGYDLLGSAIGALGFPLVVIPLAGVQAALLAMAAAGVLALAVIWAGGGARRMEAE